MTGEHSEKELTDRIAALDQATVFQTHAPVPVDERFTVFILCARNS
jgi:hypothetical protein